MAEKDGSSEEKTDIWGNKYTQHYDEDGNKTGTTEDKETLLFGDKYTQHYDEDSNKTGTSEDKETLLFGDEYTQHYDEDSNKTGTSENKETLLFGDKYTQHYDEDSNKTGTSEDKETLLFGDRYTQHYNESSFTKNKDRKNTFSAAGQSQSCQTESTKGVGWLFAIIAIIIVVWIASNFDNGERTTSASVRSPEEIAEKQKQLVKKRKQLEEKRKLAREALLRTFNFGQWNVGQSLALQGSPLNFCTRPCSRRATGSASIRLVSITKISTAAISLRFSIRTTSKNQYLPGFSENRADNDYLLFVKSDSYINLGFGSSAIKSLYAKAMHLLDGQGKKYKSISGIEGVDTTGFNRHAFRAILPFDSESFFNVQFPVPTTTTSSLKFVSPRLSGHQGGWNTTVYDSNKI